MPLIVAGSGVAGGRVVSATVGLVDLAPTVAELAGASLPGTDGVSLRTWWTGAEAEKDTHDGKPMWEETLHPLYESGWAPLRYWSMWFFGLAVAVMAFYVVLTPVWIGLRAAAWMAEFKARRRS